ncbi:hypothetical protein H0H81_006632 [Sphagnurus paluster]|uniref:Uncharacterized protein n=1 Tax=Sphagnurus paluster TaxID=117069 RepID=A0A9P7K566_9AGAR|nr:hypothetical protein H0H81_006632 [Sphagnurus paluster]
MSNERSHDEKYATGSTPPVYSDMGDEAALPPPPALTEAEEKRLYRKIDARLLPILALLYLLSFIDRGNAKLQGLTTQLHLTGNQYNIALVRADDNYVPPSVAE